jgi:hypothetical protein
LKSQAAENICANGEKSFPIADEILGAAAAAGRLDLLSAFIKRIGVTRVEPESCRRSGHEIGTSRISCLFSFGQATAINAAQKHSGMNNQLSKTVAIRLPHRS